MRLIASILLCGVALTAGAAEIWRWKDANGVVHYSDTPRPGAERIAVDAPRPGGDSPPVVEQEVSESDSGSSEASEQASEAPTQESRPPGYSACEVVSPGHGENFQGVQAITVALSVQPELQRGHRIQLFVNGAAQPDWPAQALTFTLPEVVRGSHTLSVRILDARGRTVCTGPPITFQLRQQSVIRPAQSGA